MTDSLPCPFCGGTALLTYGTGAFTGCRTCGADGPQRVNGPDRDWNTRAAGPLTSHGYRPEHGDPLAWAAELLDTVTTGADASNEEVFRLMDEVEDLNRKLTQARNDIGALEAANATLVDLITKFRDSYHRPRRGFLSRFIGTR